MKSENGRSMVEMLGVLAIIGVLSVGAISGYSKAMFKYKLNKHTEQMNTVINAVARHAHSFDNIQHRDSLIPYFIKMGEIPTEMVSTNDGYYIFDVFRQAWYIRIEGGAIVLASMYDVGSSFLSSFLSSNSPENLAICQNTLNIAKENADNIDTIVIYTANSGSANNKFEYILGDKLCTAEYMQYDKCLKNLTLNDVHTLCTEQLKNGYGLFQLSWEQ